CPLKSRADGSVHGSYSCHSSAICLANACCTATHSLLHRWRTLLRADAIIVSEHLVAPVAMKCQNSHTISWKCQTGILPRTPSLHTVPWTPGQNTLGRHVDLLAEVRLVDEEEAHARMIVILSSIDADWLRRIVNRH